MWSWSPTFTNCPCLHQWLMWRVSCIHRAVVRLSLVVRILGECLTESDGQYWPRGDQSASRLDSCRFSLVLRYDVFIHFVSFVLLYSWPGTVKGVEGIPHLFYSKVSGAQPDLNWSHSSRHMLARMTDSMDRSVKEVIITNINLPRTLSGAWVTMGGVWIDYLIYWTLIHSTRIYK